ncbi:MAG: hypothetical protein FJ291_19245 [Planctomycetes bacterium]|nr:hypothetical protein [Planctomycetota bacterium]
MAESFLRPSHFAYAPFTTEDDLQQGDILLSATALGSLLDGVHPHFVDPKYTGFLVLTQTCDLERRPDRGGRCRSSYINLAVIRKLQDVLHDLLGKVCTRLSERAYHAADKNRAKELLERVINQNEQALGLFYLHPDAAIGFAEPCVALLQVSFALRAQHYEALVDVRRGRLKEIFQARLGWLVGNLYSRVAVQDVNESDRDAVIADMLSPQAARPDAPQWVDRRRFIWMRQQAGGPVEGLPKDKFDELLAQYSQPSPRDGAIDRVLSVLGQVIPGMTEEQKNRLVAKLKSDSRFDRAFR